jgi:acyl-CoA thioesterase-1
MYPKLANKEGIELLPFFLQDVATQKEYIQADNIHPNEKAQTVLFRNVWDAMGPYQNLLKSK